MQLHELFVQQPSEHAVSTIEKRATALRWLDTVCQGQYLPILSVNYDAINKDLEKLTPQLY